ncbi:MAG: hypothetical protein AB7O59_24785 [Pirellulales bacterium]
MSFGSEPDELRHELAAARAALARDAQAAAADARTLADWRHHFRAHPWVWCGSAAALGYLIVPARRASAPIAAQTLNMPAAQVAAPKQPVMKSAAAGLAALGARWLAQQAWIYATQRGMDYLKTHAARTAAPPKPYDAEADY